MAARRRRPARGCSCSPDSRWSPSSSPSTSSAMPSATRSTPPQEPTVAEPLLSVRDLSVTFPNRSGDVHAVRGVSYDISEGEFFGIVGESGSGKSVSSLAIMGLLPDNAQLTGEIRFGGRNLLELGDRELSRIRGRDISIVFQDPLSALTPVYTVGDQIGEAVRIHDRTVTRKAAEARAVDLLRIVGIPDPVRRASAFAHEFSGGMRQRVMIAMAI